MKLMMRLAAGSICLLLAACETSSTDSVGDRSPPTEAAGGSARAASAGAGSPPAATRPAAAHTVTLITGDRVTLGGPSGPVTSIQAGPGRRSMRFRTAAWRERVVVMPADAQPLVAAGVLDPRLFDVTGLLELGYGDARRDDLPVLVTRTGVNALARSALSAAGAAVERPLPSVGGEALSVPKGRAAEVWTALAGAGARASLRGVGAGLGAKVWLDGRRSLALDRSAAQIGAPIAWDAGYTGAGVALAVLDTGVEASHPDFAGRIAAARNFVDDGSDPDEAPDHVGHGTHVASIAAGSGAAGGGVYRGVAPDATLLVGKVCEAWGCPESAVIAGMEWAAAAGARVVNLSVGGPDTPGADPLEQSIDALTAEHGTLFVVAAGNFPLCGGPGSRRVTSPGTADAALSVGAVDRDDALAPFSCGGPRVGDGAVKPEITAPGVDIVAARAVGTPDGDTSPVDGSYARLSGTSMAAPHVAGTALLLAQQHPDWRAPELKAALVGSARPTDDASIHRQGAGRVDVGAAVEQLVLGSPANLSLGAVPWPHDDDDPLIRTLTYRNLGDAAIELGVSIEGVGPDGQPAPPAMFSASPASIAVPPGGEATITVTVDTRGDLLDGAYAAMVVASGGGQVVRTPVGVHRERELHDVVLHFLDRQGQPTEGAPRIFDLQTGEALYPPVAGGAAALRLPPGQYLVDSLILAPDEGGAPSATFLVQPLLEVSGPTGSTFDARTAALDDQTVPDDQAQPIFEIATYVRAAAAGPVIAGTGVGWPSTATEHTYYGHVGPELAPGDFWPILSSAWARPEAPESDDPFFGSPTAYNLVFAPPGGRFPTGFRRHLAAADLAAVELHVAATSPGRYARFISTGKATPLQFGVSFDGVAFHTPARRTEYFTTEEGSAWEHLLLDEDARLSFNDLSTPAPVAYQPGPAHHARWNHGVLAPSFPDRAPAPALYREGDFLVAFDLSSLSDSEARRGRAGNLELGALRLFGDGELLGESDDLFFSFFLVPPEEREYRLELETVRDPGADRSTRVETAWTFRSAEAFGSLPVFTVRYQPELDRRHRAPGGAPFVVPISIDRQLDAGAAPVRRLRVAASYDGGVTWRPAPVIRFGDVGFALLFHPLAGTVSLRARAEDEAGGAVEQTIVDAYHLR